MAQLPGIPPVPGSAGCLVLRREQLRAPTLPIRERASRGPPSRDIPLAGRLGAACALAAAGLPRCRGRPPRWTIGKAATARLCKVDSASLEAKVSDLAKLLEIRAEEQQFWEAEPRQLGTEEILERIQEHILALQTQVKEQEAELQAERVAEADTARTLREDVELLKEVQSILVPQGKGEGLTGQQEPEQQGPQSDFEAALQELYSNLNTDSVRSVLLSPGPSTRSRGKEIAKLRDAAEDVASEIATLQEYARQTQAVYAEFQKRYTAECEANRGLEEASGRVQQVEEQLLNDLNERRAAETRLQQQLAEQLERNEALKQQVDAQQRAQEQLRQELSAARESEQTAQDQMQRQVRELQEQLEKRARDQRELQELQERREEEAEDLQELRKKQMQDLQDDLLKLSQELKEQREMQAQEHQALRVQLESKEAEMTALRSELYARGKALGIAVAEQTRLRDSAREAQEALDELQGSLSEPANEVRLRAERQGEEMEQLKQSLKEVESHLSLLTGELLRNEQRLEAALTTARRLSKAVGLRTKSGVLLLAKDLELQDLLDCLEGRVPPEE